MVVGRSLKFMLERRDIIIKMSTLQHIQDTKIFEELGTNWRNVQKNKFFRIRFTATNRPLTDTEIMNVLIDTWKKRYQNMSPVSCTEAKMYRYVLTDFLNEDRGGLYYTYYNTIIGNDISILIISNTSMDQEERNNYGVK